MEKSSESMKLSKDLISSFERFKRMMINRQRKRDSSDRLCGGLKERDTMLLMKLKDIEKDYPKGINVSQLSTLLYIKPPSVTAMVAGLEKQGMVQRSMSKEDRRIVHILLTEKGSRFVADNRKKFLLSVNSLVEHLGTDKSRILVSIIDETYDFYRSEFRKRDNPSDDK